MGFQCSLDGGTYVACASPHTIDPLSSGMHTLRVRAVDLAGNADQTPAEHTWTVVPPTTTITSKPADPAMTTTATFEFSSPAPGAVFECSLDFGLYAACTSPTTYTNLGIGSHSFAVRAKDGAGNVDPNPPRYYWTVMSGPVKMIVGSGTTSFYSTIDGAFASLPTGTPATVLTQNLVYMENPVSLGIDASVALKGGYDSAYGTVVGVTTIRGSLVIQRGSLDVSNLVIM